MAKLNPPILEKTLPAFAGNSNIRIPYGLNRAVSINDFSKIHIKVKTVSTNSEVYNGYSNNANVKTDGYAQFSFDNGFTPTIGQYYKVQLAFFNGEIGYYSDVGVIKCTSSSANAAISGLSSGINLSRFNYTGVYSHTGDVNEKAYSYQFKIYEGTGNKVYEDSGVLLHNSSTDTILGVSQDTWTPTKGLKPGVQYSIEYSVTTLNLYSVKSSRYIIQDKNLVSPPTWFDGQLHATPCIEEGYIDLTLHGNKLSGDFILNRASSKDNFATWQQITQFTIAQGFNGLSVWKDFTIEQGIEYLYSIQMCNSNNIRTIHMYPQEYKVMGDFEDMFLSDGKRQLKIRFNPKVSSFKTTRLESKVDTIGSQFPFFFRNGNVEYKEFPISGLISVLSDDNSLFILENDTSNKMRQHTPSGAAIPDGVGRTQLTAENLSAEREFKLEVLNWLNNGEYKLFRSPGEGNYIVRLLNVTLSPNDTLGRMVHTFNCNAYEAMEYNFANLRKYGYLRIEEKVDYSTQHITSSLDVYNYPHEGVIIENKRVTPQNGWTMRNIKITNMAAYGIVKSSSGTYKADKFGNVTIASATWIEFVDDVSLVLATLDFDIRENKHSDWNSFANKTSVTLTEETTYKNLYNTAQWASTYVKADNTFDYLKYLNTIAGQVGEVQYLYIRKRTISVGEIPTTNYILRVDNYEHNATPVVAGGGYVYQNLGTLCQLECGRGFDIDIIYTKKTLS